MVLTLFFWFLSVSPVWTEDIVQAIPWLSFASVLPPEASLLQALSSHFQQFSDKLLSQIGTFPRTVFSLLGWLFSILHPTDSIYPWTLHQDWLSSPITTKKNAIDKLNSFSEIMKNQTNHLLNRAQFLFPLVTSFHWSLHHKAYGGDGLFFAGSVFFFPFFSWSFSEKACMTGKFWKNNSTDQKRNQELKQR